LQQAAVQAVSGDAGHNQQELVSAQAEQENELHARKERILIVDDSELNRALLTEMLEDDYEILEAANGQECMDILNAGSDKFR